VKHAVPGCTAARRKQRMAFKKRDVTTRGSDDAVFSPPLDCELVGNSCEYPPQKQAASREEYNEQKRYEAKHGPRPEHVMQGMCMSCETWCGILIFCCCCCSGCCSCCCCSCRCCCFPRSRLSCRCNHEVLRRVDAEMVPVVVAALFTFAVILAATAMQEVVGESKRLDAEARRNLQVSGGTPDPVLMTSHIVLPL